LVYLIWGSFFLLLEFICFIDHKENKEILTITVIQQLFKRIASLLNSSDENIQIEAGAGYD